MADDRIPMNADKILFVEDLLGLVSYLESGIIYPSWRVGKYREFIYNAFDEDCHHAVLFLTKSLEFVLDHEFLDIREDHGANMDSFLMYAAYHARALDKGLDPNLFLNFCVRVSIMAVYFKFDGVSEVLDAAFQIMLKAFEDNDMFQGGWDALKIICRKYADIGKAFFNARTPETSEDESLSD